MALTIAIDRSLCVGSSMCVRSAPNTFDTDVEGTVTLVEGEHDSDERIRVAVSSCPVGALSIVP
jgi:ferredoxin